MKRYSDLLKADEERRRETDRVFSIVKWYLRACIVACAGALLFFALSGCTVTRPVMATGNFLGAKEGRSTATRICGVWVAGDASIATAARSADIMRISTVDLQTTNVLWLYVRETCIVRGYYDNVHVPGALNPANQ